jgi:hypothetical protein
MRGNPLSRRRIPVLFVALGVLPAALAACDIQVRKGGDVDVDVFSAETKQEWTRSYPLAPGGQIDVANLNGPIELSKAAGTAVDIRAEIIARGFTDAIVKNLLEKGKIEETVSPERVKVETVVPRGTSGRYEVRYHVALPPGITAQVSTTNGGLRAAAIENRVKASIVNGAVDFSDMGGEIDATLVNGSLTARFARVTAPVRLETTNGRLSLEIPKDTKATLSARVVNGGMSVKGLPIDEPPQRRIRNLEAALNGGGPAIELHTTNGRITITGTP